MAVLRQLCFHFGHLGSSRLAGLQLPLQTRQLLLRQSYLPASHGRQLLLAEHLQIILGNLQSHILTRLGQVGRSRSQVQTALGYLVGDAQTGKKRYAGVERHRHILRIAVGIRIVFGNTAPHAVRITGLCAYLRKPLVAARLQFLTAAAERHILLLDRQVVSQRVVNALLQRHGLLGSSSKSSGQHHAE